MGTDIGSIVQRFFFSDFHWYLFATRIHQSAGNSGTAPSRSADRKSVV